MDITVLTWINTLVLIGASAYIIRTSNNIAAIQRAIFLQLRRQYQDIDKDLQEVRDLLRKEA